MAADVATLEPAADTAPQQQEQQQQQATDEATDAALDDLLAKVRDAKTVLEDASSPPELTLKAIANLQSHGALPTKILSATLIGKAVNTVAKISQSKEVKQAALNLVNEWKQTHRKRKAGQAGLDSQASTDSLALGRSDSLLSNAVATDDVPATPEEPEAKPEEKEPEPVPLTPQREKVVQKLTDLLLLEVEDKGGDEKKVDDLKDPAVLAAEIEKNLFDHLGKNDKEYLNQARAILFNLKDKKNIVFKFKVAVGALATSQMYKLTPKEMASAAKNAERDKMMQDAMDAIDANWAMKKGHINISGMFTCGKCKGSSTTYFQMQTRSSDEPMTTFAQCLADGCGNRWKFC